MDAVVLAAGRNDRLKGYVPAYMKPLMLVNGEPLIVTLCQSALRAVEGDVVVVVAPQNADPVTQVLSQRFDFSRFVFVVQPAAVGPACALSLGMRAVAADEVLVLCGDNLVPDDDMGRAVSYIIQPHVNVVVCCTRLPRDRAERFSRFNSTQDALVEGPLGVGETGPDFLCWCGPVAARCRHLRAAFQAMPDQPMLSAVFTMCGGLDGFVGNSRDLGVPEALS